MNTSISLKNQTTRKFRFHREFRHNMLNTRTRNHIRMLSSHHKDSSCISQIARYHVSTTTHIHTTQYTICTSSESISLHICRTLYHQSISIGNSDTIHTSTRNSRYSDDQIGCDLRILIDSSHCDGERTSLL